MSDSELSELELVLAAEQDILLNPARYREAIAWWNDNYSRSVYRKKVTDDRRQRRRSGEKLHRTRHGKAWHHENRADWFFLARAGEAMHTFPTDPGKWRRLGLRDAARILLVTILITRPDFDGTRIGLDERAQWSDGALLNDDECFGRDWADRGFTGWDDEDGDNGLWLKLAKAAWKVVQSMVVMGAKPQAPAPNMPPQAAPQPVASVRQACSFDKPVPFTDHQRELFRRVARLVRFCPHEFVEAGQWLDAEADLPSIPERIKRTRQDWLTGARSRRQVGRKSGRDAGRAYLIPMEGPTLPVSRVILARRIREERINAGSSPSPYEIIQAAASKFLNEPPNYDAMKPNLAEQDARRMLLVVWILTDPADLRTTPIVTALQEWEWGEHPLEFLGEWPDGAEQPIPRLLARTMLLDRELLLWEQLTRDALRIVSDIDDARSSVEKGVGDASLVHTHSADFTMVNWFGTEYTFALGVQSSAVRVLWEEWEKTGLGLHQETIRNAIDAERDSFRLDTAFRNHPAFGTMIQRCGDGKYKLASPSAEPPAPKPKAKKSAGITSKSRRKRV